MLFDPEPEKKGNSNTGENLKLITQYPEKTAKILDCSEELLSVLHELLGMIESTKAQDPEVMESLSKRIFYLFQQDFGAFSKLSPSFHRALAHSAEFARYYQNRGFTMLRLRRTLQVLAFVVHTKSKIWVVSAEIGLLETLSRCSMLNKCVCRIAMILWRVLPLLIFNN